MAGTKFDNTRFVSAIIVCRMFSKINIPLSEF